MNRTRGRQVEKAASGARSPAPLVQHVAPESPARLARSAREARDLAVLNEAADTLNREMDDALGYQADA